VTDRKLDYDPPVPDEPDQFTKVDNAHIIPRFWLRRFADDNDLICVVRPKGESEYKTSTRRAGIRNKFYSRTRPKTGERIDDFEWSMSQLEGPSAQGISEIEANWPLNLEQKATLAQLFGLQLVRGPDYRFYHGRLAADEITRFVLDGAKIEQAAIEEAVDAEGLVPIATGVADDTERLLRMNLLSAKVSASLGSMTWTLLRRDADELALSDQPVAIWPIGIESQLRRAEKLWVAGLVNLLEVRVPVSPRLAVLMTWADRPDDAEPVDINAQQAININSFTIVGADEEWFRLPGSDPRANQGPWFPLSRQLFEGYTTEAAQNSKVRREMHKRLNSRVGEDIQSLDEHGRATIEMIFLNR
jgi:hypothetical protein